ncbi:MAG: signal peptidase I [Desulfobulbaceae bacterium]|nr:signal peptidase I [Desulfobulbaceae bacterium]
MKSIGLHISTIVFAVLVALTIRTYAVQAFKIPSGSMNHTIFVGDYILVNKCLYSFKNPEQGDIIVFRYPENKDKDFIMRIVAEGGDEIEIIDKQVSINNGIIYEPYKGVRNRFLLNHAVGWLKSVPDKHLQQNKLCHSQPLVFPSKRVG